ncbi:hypothetical protein D3C78_1978930 [compost metagenome]
MLAASRMNAISASGTSRANATISRSVIPGLSDLAGWICTPGALACSINTSPSFSNSTMRV